MEQHAADPASPQTSGLFNTLVLLPGAYAVVKSAQAQGGGDPELLADLETAIMLLNGPIGEYREELAAYAALSPARRSEQMPQTIEKLLEGLKRAERTGKMRGIIHKIMEMGSSSREPGKILAAIEAFSKKEPQLSSQLEIPMERMRILARASFMEGLADLRKDFPSAASLRPPRQPFLVKMGRVPQPCKN
jgi:hypothetical protein